MLLDSGGSPNLLETVLRSTKPDPVSSRTEQVRSFSKTNVSAGGVDFSLADWPREKTVREALSFAMHPQTRVFWTHLKPSDVMRAIEESSSKMGDGLSEISRQNAIMIAQEVLSPMYELVLQEKPRECDVPDGAPRREGLCSEWFGVSRDGSKIGDRTLFARQFARYCKLRESFEFLACKKLQEAISCTDNLLTAGMKAAIGYEKGSLKKKKLDMGFERNDFAACAFGNYLEKQALNGRFIFNISHATHHYVLISLGILDYGRFAFDLHFNFFNSGPGSTSKSFVCQIVLKQLFPGSVQEVDSMTPKSFHVEMCLADLLIYIDEMSKDMQGGADESDVLATLLKRITTGQRLTLTEFCWVEDAEGRKRRTQRTLITVVMGCIGGSGNKITMTPAMCTRYFITRVSKHALIMFGKKAQNIEDDLAFKVVSQKLMNHLSSGTSPQALFSQCGNDFVKLCDRSHSDVGTVQELLEEHGDRLFQEFVDELPSNQKNFMNGRVADLFLSNAVLPVTTIMQSMFQENLQGEDDAPFSSGTTKTKAIDAVRVRQLLVLYVFKLMQVKALPDVNLTQAHMVIQKYFEHLKLHGNVEPDTYRTIVRILIMCRIVTIIEGLLYLYFVEGCDHPVGDPFELGTLLGIKPYLFCSEKNALFACTLLSEEYMGPYDSSIIKTLGYSICRYYDEAKLEECLSSYSNIKHSLEKIRGGIISDGDLLSILEKTAPRDKSPTLAGKHSQIDRADKQKQQQKQRQQQIALDGSCSKKPNSNSSAFTSGGQTANGPLDMWEEILRQGRYWVRVEEKKKESLANRSPPTIAAAVAQTPPKPQIPIVQSNAVPPPPGPFFSALSTVDLPADRRQVNNLKIDDDFQYDDTPPCNEDNVEIEIEDDSEEGLSEAEYLAKRSDASTGDGNLASLCDAAEAEGDEEFYIDDSAIPPAQIDGRLPDKVPLSDASAASSAPSVPSPPNPLEIWEKDLKRLLEKKDLMPHEIFLLDQDTQCQEIHWELVETKVTSSDTFVSPGHPGEALNSREGLPEGERTTGNRGHGSFEFGSKKIKAYNLNYLNPPYNFWNAASAILRCMFGVGPSPTDVVCILQELCKHKVLVPLSYAKPMTSSDIKALAGLSVESLLADKILVRGRTYHLLKENPKSINASGYSTPSSISLLVHSLKNCVDPRELMVDAIRSMVHRGMKPCRIPLGIMADPNRAKFAWVDISEQDIRASKKRCWEVAKGSFMTERETNVVFGKAPSGSRRSRPDDEEEPRPGENEGDAGLEEEEDVSKWFSAFKSHQHRDGTGGESDSNVLRIHGDVNEWMALRHFLNVGIPHGPHPLRPEKIVWYYRPLVKKGTVGKTYVYDDSRLEYRDLPTPYNQHMRALYHIRHQTPETFEAHMADFDKSDVLWFARSTEHFRWLGSADRLIRTEDRQLTKNGKRKNFPSETASGSRGSAKTQTDKGKEDVSQEEDLIQPSKRSKLAQPSQMSQNFSTDL